MIAGPLIAGTLALLQAAEPPPAVQSTQRVATSRLEIPDAIASAIVPYVQCVMARQGVPVRPAAGQAPVQPVVPVGGDCSPHRAQAARRAEEMLRVQGRGHPSETRALVERVLVSVDGFADSVAHPPAHLPDREPDAED